VLLRTGAHLAPPIVSATPVDEDLEPDYCIDALEQLEELLRG
jgi:hypothetical protein